jgi:hypothetical protein
MEQNKNMKWKISAQSASRLGYWQLISYHVCILNRSVISFDPQLGTEGESLKGHETKTIKKEDL